jgi:tetratricopeptide (TPR) repeat protein
VRADVHLWHGAGTDTELELKLERLKDELTALRRGFRRWQKLVAGLSLAAVILVGCLFLVQWRANQTTDVGIKQLDAQVKRANQTTDVGIKQLGVQVKKVIEGQTVTDARIRIHLVEASEHARDAALEQAEKEPRFDERERLRQQANKAHEIRLGRIDELATSFVALERQADTSPVLREMIRILNEEKTNPVDKAIAYAERLRPALLERVRARKLAEQERNRAELEPLLKAASMEETRGHADAARARFLELLNLEPAWPQALESYAYFLHDQSVQATLHGSLHAALADAQRSFDVAARLYTQDSSRLESERVLSFACNQLGDVLVIRGEPGDADQALKHYTRSLELAEALLKRNPDSAQAARDVLISLERLGDFLARRGQPGDAEQALKHYTRSLELAEALLKRNPDSAQAAHDVMLSHYKLGELDAWLQRFESAIARFGAGIAVLDGMIARGMDAETATREKASLEERVQFCRLAPLATGDWDALIKMDPKPLPVLLSLRATAMAQRGRLADVAQAGAKLRELEPKTNENLYNAACAYGLCAALVVKDKPAPTQGEAAESQKYIDLTMDCLKEAIATGFNDFDHLQQDSDLAALRGLPEFQSLIPKPAGK